jgi:flagella basal body P-ring formation protein FlgA
MKARYLKLRWFLAVCGFLAFVLGGTIAISSAWAADNALPVPTVVIYPGDTIKDAWLADRDFPPGSLTSRAAVFDSRAAVVGKMARRTLLPGVPIPMNAISDPKVITNGARVRVVFQEGGLTISTYGSALQAGGIGDIVSVRNLDSGLTVSGTVQPDGSVLVSGS